MQDERLEAFRRKTRLRKQEEERRRREEAAANLRLRQQEGQAQDEARALVEGPPAEEHYAQLPQHSHTGIR
ncbi:hypothetical protein AB0G86_05850 [Streptomyces scabiei]|uniref:hypothetical protein n=1 Tax=Streptomyces scabiei TaxID=1930 RepID=UPI0033E64D17